MEYSTWQPYYEQIVADLHLDVAADTQAALEAAKLAPRAQLASIGRLSALIFDRRVLVCGDGPALRQEVTEHPFSGTRIAADGATSTLMTAGIRPEIIVTDLDGRVEDQLQANGQGSLLVVHAHGDNLPALRRYLPKVAGPLLLTTQTQPSEEVHNFGGFTDGDRAVFLADHFGAATITLVGFDFTTPSSSSGKTPSERKLRKLTWAAVLIGMLQLDNLAFIGEGPPQSWAR